MSNTSRKEWLQRWRPIDFSGLSALKATQKKKIFEAYVKAYVAILNIQRQKKGLPLYKVNFAWAQSHRNNKKYSLQSNLNPPFKRGRPRKPGSGPGQITPAPPPQPGR